MPVDGLATADFCPLSDGPDERKSSLMFRPCAELLDSIGGPHRHGVSTVVHVVLEQRVGKAHFGLVRLIDP